MAVFSLAAKCLLTTDFPTNIAEMLTNLDAACYNIPNKTKPMQNNYET